LYKHRITTAIVILLTISIFPITTQQPSFQSKPTEITRFVVAGWDYPDVYGQGIDDMSVYQWVNGQFKGLTQFGLDPDYAGRTTVDIYGDGDGGGNITIYVDCWLNGTLTGADSLEAGKSYLRHSVNLASPENSSIFSQQNFTYSDGSDSQAPMYFYIYNVTLDFTPVSGVSYTVTIDYDVYYTPDYSLLDSDTTPTWGGLYLGEGGDGTDENLFYSFADGDNDEDGAIETGITVSNSLGNITFNLDVTITAYNEQCTSIDITVMLWSGVASGVEDIVYSGSLTGTGAVNITGYTLLSTIESFLVNITYVGTVSGDYVNMTIDSYSVEYTTYAWRSASNPIIYLIAPMSQTQVWGLNAFTILLGLIMIPTSTMYLVRGGRDELSNSKVFYFLVIFFMGWALLLGGIMP